MAQSIQGLGMFMSVSVGRRRWVFRALGNSPLVRRLDRLEAIATVLVLILVVAAIPLGVLVGGASHSAGMARSLEKKHSLHSVEATVVEVRVDVHNRLPNAVRQVGVQWSSVFSEREGFLSTAEPVRVGDHMTVWLDKDGELAEPPKSDAEVMGAAIGAGLVVSTGAVLVCLLALAGLRCSLNRRRYASWGHEWEVFSASGGGWANRDH